MTDAIQAKSLGYKTRALYIKEPCPGCGKMRHVRMREAGTTKCRSCARKEVTGERCPRWNGGKKVSRGYTYIFVKPDHPYFEMAHIDGNGYSIAEHRLVVAQTIGRMLKSHEIVHHINRKKSDNRPENLELVTSRHDHSATKYWRDAVKQLQFRVIMLESEVELLKAQISTSGYGNPELSGEPTSPKCVETIYRLSNVDKEIVHPLEKSRESDAYPKLSQAPTPAALEDSSLWRCENAPKTRNAKHVNSVQANPVLADGLDHQASGETLQGAPTSADAQKEYGG